MGFYSWLTSDTGEPIPNTHQTEKEVFPVKMLGPNGEVFYEPAYDGFGVFGGKAFYEFLAEINGLEGYEAGLNLAHPRGGREKQPHIKPKIVRAECETPWEELPDSDNDPCQGFFY